jgi:hypothetical protein
MHVLLRIKNLCLLLLLVLLPSLGMATSLISTAPGGAADNGYQANMPAVFGNTNVIRGHIMFKNGFTFSGNIPNNATIWDSDGIVNGPVKWNTLASTFLKLTSDLRLGSTATLVRNGSGTMGIIGEAGGNKSIILGGDITLSFPLTVSAGNLSIDGGGHTLKITNTANSSNAISASSGQIITLRNMTLVIDSNNKGSGYGFFNSSSAANLVLENVAVRVVPYSNSVGVVKSSATLTIRGNVSIDSPGGLVALSGSATFATLVIERNSTLRIGQNTIFTLAANGGAINSSVTLTDATSVLHLDGCDFYTSPYSASLNVFNLLGGTLLLENKVRIFNTYYGGSTGNTDMTKAFILGDGTASNDVNVRVLKGAYVTLDGSMKYNHS